MRYRLQDRSITWFDGHPAEDGWVDLDEVSHLGAFLQSRQLLTEEQSILAEAEAALKASAAVLANPNMPAEAIDSALENVRGALASTADNVTPSRPSEDGPAERAHALAAILDEDRARAEFGNFEEDLGLDGQPFREHATVQEFLGEQPQEGQAAASSEPLEAVAFTAAPLSPSEEPLHLETPGGAKRPMPPETKAKIAATMAAKAASKRAAEQSNNPQ